MLNSALKRRLCRFGSAIMVATGLAFGAAGNVLPAPWRALPTIAAYAQSQQPPDGLGPDCVEFGLLIPPFPFVINSDSLFPDEGWVWIEPKGRRLRAVSGLVTNTDVARNDTPSNHESHDSDTAVLVDTGYEGLVSPANHHHSDDPAFIPDPANPPSPNVLGIEWETGIRPSEKRGDGANPIFPKWAWPSVGDRVWAEGHWVYDCGHPSDVDGAERFRSEIHPPRAMATMRDQAAALPGTGTTPVPVTATDLYIHGYGGFVTSQLTCGMGIILNLFGLPDGCHTVLTPIDDTDFVFDVCLPPRPNHPFARLITSVDDGSGNTVLDSVAAPNFQEVTASDDCQRGDQFDDGVMLRVTIPLNGKPVAASSVYARRILSGWVFPPAEVLRRLNVTLNKMDLHDDTDDIPFDQGELTFTWMGVNRAASEWIRLADHTEGMNNYDDSPGAGNGEKSFTNAGFDFYVRTGQPFTVNAHGYDQDCFDDYFGQHFLFVPMYVGCWTVDIDEFGNNDALVKLPIEKDVTDDFGNTGRREEAIFRADENYGIDVAQDLHAWFIKVATGSNNQIQRVLSSKYELELTVSEVAHVDEDRADLEVTKRCTPSGEVFLANEPFSCTVLVTNRGPGLPRSVQLRDVLSGQLSGAITITGATASLPAPYVGPPVVCSIGASTFSCDLGTVPVGATATILATVVTTTPGALENTATVSTASTDANLVNNQSKASIDVFRPIRLDIAPGALPNSINLGKSGVVSVAVLTTPEFDARLIQISGLCFGNAAFSSLRDCTEAHGTLHTSDVDRDRDIDLLLHFEPSQTGIGLNDTTACLIGRASDGIGIYGCDSVRIIGT